MTCLRDDILAQVADVPPLPTTVLKLINVLNDPESTVTDIVETIKYDPALTTQMLRLCNSAYFGLSREVDSLNDAIRFLGTLKVLQLVMAVHSNAMLSKAQHGYGLEPGVLWRHSVAVALGASAFAQQTEIGSINLAFTAGLLHDIGKIVLNQFVAESFLDIVQHVTDNHVSFCEAEKHILGFSHEEIGIRLAQKWQLPDTLVQCIGYHHRPGELDPPRPMVDTVYLSNCVCLLLGMGLGADGLTYRADEKITERYGLHESDLEMIGAQIATELKRVEAIFEGASTGQAQPAYPS